MFYEDFFIIIIVLFLAVKSAKIEMSEENFPYNFSGGKANEKSS